MSELRYRGGVHVRVRSRGRGCSLSPCHSERAAALDPGSRPAGLAAFGILAALVFRASLSCITRSGTPGGEELPTAASSPAEDQKRSRRAQQQRHATDSQGGPPSAHSTMRLTRSALRPYVCPSCRSGPVAGRRRFASQPEPVPDIYDVVCVGGGPAGLGLLAALSMSASASVSVFVSVSTESTLI